MCKSRVDTEVQALPEKNVKQRVGWNIFTLMIEVVGLGTRNAE